MGLKSVDTHKSDKIEEEKQTDRQTVLYHVLKKKEIREDWRVINNQ